ncbi:hypothetical protein [Hymenobacter edaphi]|uniref:hypothetical protein n=1 Tax=Hymenobacter edaphi TaxID=2211146 RepID=UPI001403BF1F|nr:hypothetical protein [Hymenobacter edaphi]
MTANSRQMKLLQRPAPSGRGARGPARQLVLLLALLLSGLLRPERPLAAATAVVARQTDEALAACARHAVLAALLPGAEVAAPQPPPEPLPLPSALLLPALLQLPDFLPSPALPAATRPGLRAHLGATARLTSEVPNGP